MVSQYNNIKPSSIKMPPINVSNPENLYRTYMNLYGDIVHDNSLKTKLNFAVLDKICITRMKMCFAKVIYLAGLKNYCFSHTIYRSNNL
jgi:hypothetical protein